VYDPATDDPAQVDLEFPATLIPLAFDSHGDQLIGNMLIAQGRGPHPTVVLLHGFPGNENNYDLGHACRRAGWNVLLFHYRGCWGSQGDYCFAHVLEDVHAALAFLRAPSARELYRLNSENLALVGHSMGGFAALMVAALDPTIHAVASLAGANRGMFNSSLQQDPAARAQTQAGFQQALPRLRGCTAESLMAELAEFGERWDPVRYAPILATRSVLLVAGSRDKVVPPEFHHVPLIQALQDAGASDLTDVVLDADHVFSDKRIALTRTVVSWLSRQRSQP
jgi:uncharacterized protein